MLDMMKRAWEKVEMNEEMDERLFSQIKEQVEINENQRDKNRERKMQMKGKSVNRKMAKVAAIVIPILLGGSMVIAMALGNVQETWFVKPVSHAVLPEEVEEQKETEIVSWQDIEEISYQEGFQKMGIQTYMPTWFEDVGGTVTVKYRENENNWQEMAVYIKGTELNGIAQPISLLQIFVYNELPEWSEKGGNLILSPGEDKEEAQKKIDDAEHIEYITKGGWKAILEDFHTENSANDIYIMGKLSDGRYLFMFMNYNQTLEPEDIYPILDTIPAIEEETIKK